jgi:hypothetical protein
VAAPLDVFLRMIRVQCMDTVMSLQPRHDSRGCRGMQGGAAPPDILHELSALRSEVSACAKSTGLQFGSNYCQYGWNPRKVSVLQGERLVLCAPPS